MKITAAELTQGTMLARNGCRVEEVVRWPAGKSNKRLKLDPLDFPTVLIRWSSDRFGTGRTTDRNFCQYRLTDEFELA